MKNKNVKVVIVGGGLAGLISAICLNKASIPVVLIEKKQYPFHRVCGEYISNEVVPFLKRMDLFPEHILPSELSTFQLADIKGNTAEVDLPLGGFGISRYHLDDFLYQKAIRQGIEIRTESEVTDINYADHNFEVKLKNDEKLSADFVINAYGKRSKLDKKFNRKFIEKNSPYLGVKYHAYVDFPKHIIGLYNFPGGYCGVSHVEGNMVNICYLSRRENMKGFSSIPEMEKAILYQNPQLNNILSTAIFLRDKPEVINEISFSQKNSVENHMLMAGDTAGLITPLCGNGMAMAIHGGFLAAGAIQYYAEGKFTNRKQVERYYQKEWRSHFAKRLWVGRKTQGLFGHQGRSNFAVNLINKYPELAKKIIQLTHGKIF